jgi:hypothetical protein
VACLLIGLLAVGSVGRAARAQSDERALFGRGRLHAAATAGWGQGFEFNGDQDEVRMLAVVPRLGVGLTDEIGRSGWYRGNLDLALEPQLLLNFEPKTGWAAGAALYLRYQFLASPRLVPFVGVGAGMLALDFDGSHQDDGFNFILQGGTGAHLPLTETTALTLDVRWHHISNAGLRSPNNGIDSLMVLVGPTWFLR